MLCYLSFSLSSLSLTKIRFTINYLYMYMCDIFPQSIRYYYIQIFYFHVTDNHVNVQIQLSYILLFLSSKKCTCCLMLQKNVSKSLASRTQSRWSTFEHSFESKIISFKQIVAHFYFLFFLSFFPHFLFS